MKKIEIVGGLLIHIPHDEYKLVRFMKEKKKNKLKKSIISERLYELAQRLVDYHVFDADDNYFYLREVYINDVL